MVCVHVCNTCSCNNHVSHLSVPEHEDEDPPEETVPEHEDPVEFGE